MQSSAQHEEFYEALVRKDPGYEGVFFVGVRTTGIFCRPTCTARKPKRENVNFYRTIQEALQNGYRPCKVCQPLQPAGTVPEAYDHLITELNTDPMLKLRDGDLRARGLDPATVRRWFLKHYQMTFHTYQRLMRINKAFGSIRYGDAVTQSAFENGFESLGHFQEVFKKAFGVAPSKTRNQQVITYNRILTPLGPMLAGVTDEGVCLLEFVDRRMLPTQIQRIQKLLNATALPGDHPLLKQLADELSDYFAGKRQSFAVPLALPGTVFQQQVWQALQTIPYGTVRSYQEQAQVLGQPEAVRAVAKANGDNRLAIIVPCHRVIGKDGKLTGYGGGLWRKQWLLDHERKKL
ncbi:MAG: methylated-DNA--[protein]-cysteine S-methyltransferase [Saprospiraceae bacterium]|nr:methylated-DNA--[protein]-cysteine S-methyltransferase [Saprospiraceae bacterium]